jgi:hypothetical protein
MCEVTMSIGCHYSTLDDNDQLAKHGSQGPQGHCRTGFFFYSVALNMFMSPSSDRAALRKYGLDHACSNDMDGDDGTMRALWNTPVLQSTAHIAGTTDTGTSSAGVTAPCVKTPSALNGTVARTTARATATATAPLPPRGGILADAMGLGKTVHMHSLLHAAIE